MSDYTLGGLLGQGAQGTVFQCQRKNAVEEVRAVKFVDRAETPRECIAQEISLMQRLKHPCLAPLHQVYYEKCFICLVLDHFPGGDLVKGMKHYWESVGRIPTDLARRLIGMVLRGVDWIHSSRVIHRDLKSDNFLCSHKDISHAECRVVMSDFGCACDLAPAERLTEKIGTRPYWAPELYVGNYGYPVDLWAVGVIAFGMATGRMPLAKAVRKGTRKALMATELSFPIELPGTQEGFIRGLLEKQERERLSAAGALMHCFLTGSQAYRQELVGRESSGEFGHGLEERRPSNVLQRRRLELVDRLEKTVRPQCCAEVAPCCRGRNSRILTPKQLQASFEHSYPTVQDEEHLRIRSFAWRGPDQLLTCSDADVLACDPIPLSLCSVVPQESAIKHLLQEYGVSMEPSLLQHLISEVQHGLARLMLDASRHNCLVRVLEVTHFRIWHGEGQRKRYLVRKWNKRKEDGSLDSKWILLGLKKFAHENDGQALKRGFEGTWNLPDLDYVVHHDKTECWEEARERKDMVEVWKMETFLRIVTLDVEVTTSDPAILARIGLDPLEEFLFPEMPKVAGGPVTYAACLTDGSLGAGSWVTEAELLTLAVTPTPPPGNDVSALVDAPVSYTAESMMGLFAEFGHLLRGDSSSVTLIEGEAPGGDEKGHVCTTASGAEVRMWSVVLLQLRRASGETLLEVGQDSACLPATPHYAHESLLWSAKRLIKELLKLDENLVEIDPDVVQHLSVERAPQAAGLAQSETIHFSLLSKCVVSVKMVEEIGHDWMLDSQ